MADFRLVEKFAVLGRDDIALPLETKLPYIQSQEANVEVLTMLLALSENPTKAEGFDERKYVVEKIQEKGITWEEIMNQDPLEGDHWDVPEYSESDDDGDWVYEAKSSPVTASEEVLLQKTQDKAVYVDAMSRLSEGLLKAQFWSHRRKYVIYNEKYDPEIDFQGTFPSMGLH